MGSTASMLSWLAGTPKKYGATPEYRDAGGPDTSTAEGPETPAGVFAIRAFKTALFGTPGPATTTKAIEDPNKDPSDTIPNRRASTPASKPNGILLTPGTGNGRRKTVSFGEGIADHDTRHTRSRSGLPENCPGKFPSPWSVRSSGPPVKTTPLTQSLLDARSTKTNAADNNWQPRDCVFDLVSRRPTTTFTSESIEKPHFDFENDEGDITLDMEQPRSTSGRYWKTELESYHSETEREMKKLVKYKEMAKSYAKKKDAEALDLHAALVDERAKVARLEREVASLVAQARSPTFAPSDHPHTADQNDLERRLARQTALASEYQEKLAQFQAEKDLPRPSRPLDAARTNTELATLRQSARRAEQRSALLESENARLLAELASAKDELRQKATSTATCTHTHSHINAKHDDNIAEHGNKGAAEEQDGTISASAAATIADLQSSLDRLTASSHASSLATLRLLRESREETSDVRMETVALRRELREVKVENRTLKRRLAKGGIEGAVGAGGKARGGIDESVRFTLTGPIDFESTYLRL